MQGARAPQPGATNRPSPSGHINVPSAPDRSQGNIFLKRCAAPRAPWRAPPRPSSPRRNAPRGPAALAAGAHPDPYRTRKLSRPAPMVLQGRPCGRLGRRRPPGRVARARGGEARHEHLERGTLRGPSFRLRGFFTLTFHRHATRPPTSPPGLSAAFCVRAQAALGARCPMGPSARLSGPPSDVASLKRRRADPRGGCGPGSPRVGRGLCIWGSLGSHPPC